MIAIIGAIPATIAAIHSASNSAKADHITVLVNGEAAKRKAELEKMTTYAESLEKQIKSLEDLIVKFETMEKDGPE